MQLDNITDLVNADIRLIESDHTYILESKPTIGFCNVTTLVGDQFPPFEREKLARWLVNTSHKYSDYTEEELLQEWENIKDEGSAVHKELENYHDIKVANKYMVQLTETDAKCIESKNLEHNVRFIFENL